jgi:sterol desaturase/sphingolipid hydroxylase (fatty acid hydroxylase superfamily)
MWDGPKLLVGISLAAALTAGMTLAIEEWRWLKRAGRLTREARKEMALSLSCLLPNSIAAFGLTGFWAFVYSKLHGWAPWHVSTTLATTVAALLIVDLSYYWEHRLAHKAQLLWRLYHATHHSSAHYTIATAYRVSFANHLIAPLFYVPCVLVGFEPLLVIGLQLLTIHYQAWVHTKMIGPLGAVDRILNTPANHRIHHSTSDAHQHRNFAAIFVMWDVLFGTRVPPEPVESFGIPNARPPRTVWSLYLDPWRSR